MGQKIIQVDAFTSKPYRGNPAAVCVLDREADPGWMQRVANEMNLSETAYLVPRNDGFDLRWFTPVVEVDLCGHATVAAAHVLWEEGFVPKRETCRFHTRSGLLTARQEHSGWIQVEFPKEIADSCHVPEDAAHALGVNAFAAAYSARLSYLILELENEAAVCAARPDFLAVQRLPFEGVIITSRSKTGAPHQIVSRFFAPRKGVNEDPATGSAHCVLGPYWAPKLNLNRFDAFQASARGAEIRVEVGESRVTLSGRAVTVLRGELV